MAGTSGGSHRFKDLQLSDISCTVGDSNRDSDVAIATPTSEANYATLSTCYSSLEHVGESLGLHG